MDKLNLNKDEEMYRTFFGEDELLKENTRLYNLLLETVIECTSLGNAVLLIFRNGITSFIEFVDDNVYNLTLSDSTVYEYDDHSSTKLSKDRILHYLDYIADLNTLEP